LIIASWDMSKKKAHRKDVEDTEVSNFPFAVERTAKGNPSAAPLRRFTGLLT
jgi:hypothetical protein